ncbi:hypothetical protein [Planococcus lenghuensis]|uniref:Uncharacterized protein n=1 Tax=Planococcus lenghuensis TaxID=2213202 RepID=A0A1Q2KYT7_9BACL|nr:hypothetical protein [Planococcus lenghuensis]AQQ53313.1 hypothetical protein B0X71_09640 [Planococcus lenghuensis]
MNFWQKLFSDFNCHVATAFGQEAHYEHVNALEAERIPFRTLTGRKLDFYFSFSQNDFTTFASVPFDIYVKKEDAERARRAVEARQELP